MRPIHHRSLILFYTLSLSGCVTQGYSGMERPPEQVATISLPAPLISLLPPFWIFPLNMVARLSDDWSETVDYDIKVDELVLNRFNSVTLLPGQRNATAERKYSTSKLISSESCSSYDSHSEDKKGKKICTRITSCSGLYEVTDFVVGCKLKFPTEAGHLYKLLVSNCQFTFRDDHDSKAEKSIQCKTHIEDVREVTQTSTTEGSC
jgi:hypothetical protein